MNQPRGPSTTPARRALGRGLVALALALAALAPVGCRGGMDGSSARPSLAPSAAESDRAREALDRGRSLRQQGLDDTALAEFERAIAINPELTVAYLGAGEIYRERGDYDRAESRYANAARIEPGSFDAQYGHGLVLQLMNRLSEAVGAYLRALSIRPDDYEANLNLATTYLQLDEPGQALPYAQRAVELQPMRGPARVNLAGVYAALGEHDQAVLEYQQASELIDLTPEVMLSMTDSLGKTGRHEEMASALEQLIKSDPSPIAYERLGSARFRLREYRQSLEAFRLAVRMDPAHYPAWNGIGVCRLNDYVWSGKRDRPALDEALGALKQSLRIKPRQPRILELVSRYGA